MYYIRRDRNLLFLCVLVFRLNPRGEVETDPSRAALQSSPSCGRAFAGLDLHDGVNAHGDELRPVIIRSRPFADIKVGDGNPHEERNIRRDGSSCFRCVDVYTFYIKHTISRIGISALFGVLQNLVRAFLRLGISPGLTDAVPGNSRLALFYIELRKVPPLDDRAGVLYMPSSHERGDTGPGAEPAHAMP